MGLIDLTTRFKGLKHSNSGTRNLLVSKDINDPPKTGGISMQINHRIDDLARHTKLLARKPGLKFLGNQALLAQTNIVQTMKQAKRDGEVKKVVKEHLIKTAANTVGATLSILAQIPVNGTGTHLIRGLGGNSYLKPASPDNRSGIGGAINSAISSVASAAGGTGNTVNAARNSLNGEQTIVDRLATDFAKDYEGGIQGSEQVSGKLENRQLGEKRDETKSALNRVREEFNNSGNEYDWSYLGDPKDDDPVKSKTKERTSTVLQGGKISIDRDSTKHYFIDENGKGSARHSSGSPIKTAAGGNKGFVAFPDTEIGQLNVKEARVNNEVNQRDKTKRIKRSSAALIENYDTYLDEITVTGNKSTDGHRDRREEGLQDKADPVLAASTTATILGTDAEDIIPFEFNTFYPGNTDGKYLAFRAFLTDFSDNFSGDWAGTKYVGRGEELYNYQGFKRDISFSFKVAAFSKADMQPLYNKLNLLVGSTAPTYRNGNFMMGTLTKVTIGDYLVQTSGFISSVGLSWDSNIPWEMETEGERLPHALDVSISFTPIHDFIPTANSTFIG